jgi:hypothetical protein
MVSSQAVRQGLYERLNHTAVLAGTPGPTITSADIRHAVAPSEATYPMIVFNKQSGTPTNLVGFGEKWRASTQENQVWLVKAIAKGGSPSDAEHLAKRISERLTSGTLTISGGTQTHLTRESDVDYAEVQAGEQYHHHGALYRVISS